MRILAIVILTPLLALLLSAASTRAVEPKIPPNHLKPAGVVWDGRVFTRSTALAAWLRTRNQSYAAWAHKHAGAAHRLAKQG